MIRLVYRYCLILMLLLTLLILLIFWSGQFRTQAVALYSEARYGGIALWDMQSQVAHYLVTDEYLGGGPIAAPATSPDGSEIAFILRENKQIAETLTINDNLYLMDDFGRDVRLLLDTRGSATISGMNADPQIIWSPDGQMLAYYQNMFSAPRLWIVSRDARLITEISSSSLEDESSSALPAGASVFWSADSRTLYLVSLRDELRYQTLLAENGAELSSAQTIHLPDEVTSIDMLVPSPATAEILLYDNSEKRVYLLDIADESISPLEAIQDSELMALAWSDNGRRIAWIERVPGETRIYTLSFDSGDVTAYELPSRIARDVSFNLWLPDNPPGVIVRMQRGSFCHNIGTAMSCSDPDFFAVTWYGIRP